MKFDSKAIVEKFKKGPSKYNPDVHLEMLVNIMTNKDKGTLSAFCVEALISEQTFFGWARDHEIFGELYSFFKIYTREVWEKEGRELRDTTMPIGTINHAFEYWKLIGWSRFGISKNSRIKLNL